MRKNDFESEILRKYPPNKICDEWKFCVDSADSEARDLPCTQCDFYWELVAIEKNETSNS